MADLKDNNHGYRASHCYKNRQRDSIKDSEIAIAAELSLLRSISPVSKALLGQLELTWWCLPGLLGEGHHRKQHLLELPFSGEQDPKGLID